MILDEATSQIDLESEQLIHKALEQFIRGRTAIIITHRLATLDLADRIMVMQAGQCINVGTHAELTRAASSTAVCTKSNSVKSLDYFSRNGLSSSSSPSTLNVTIPPLAHLLLSHRPSLTGLFLRRACGAATKERQFFVVGAGE